jgi:VanZ family protein
MKARLLGGLCVTVLLVILTLGLWPFHAPKNDVTWLKHGGGLRFGRYGSVRSSGVLRTTTQTHGTSGSIEVWVQPDRWSDATFLAFYDPDSRRVLRLQQSLSDLRLEAGFYKKDDSQGTPQTTRDRLYLNDAFRRSLHEKKPTFITVTYGMDGTSVYLDGTVATTAPKFAIPRDTLTGRMIVGDSPWQPDSFQGQIRGLAVYDEELDGAQVLRHYLTWTEKGHPEITQNERNVALYLFDENAGTTIHNGATAGVGLYIPETYAVADKIALEPFWKEYNMSRSYWKSNLMNVVGFLPVGFAFYAYFTVARPIRRAMPVTVAVGAATSLTIEILQVFLPTRDSGTTDLFTNTIGTYIGAVCYRDIYTVLTKRFPWLSRLLGF